ncbi:MAG: hypothetical protein AAF717_02760 [Bacteroidota bacterium]
MSSKNRIAITGMSIVIGVFSLLLFTKITRDILFDGLNFCSTSSSELYFGSALLVVSAIITGFLAALLVIRDNSIPHYVISAVILAKMYLVISCVTWSAPFFYEFGVHICMIGGIWVGNLGAQKFPLAPM